MCTNGVHGTWIHLYCALFTCVEFQGDLVVCLRLTWSVQIEHSKPLTPPPSQFLLEERCNKVWPPISHEWLLWTKIFNAMCCLEFSKWWCKNHVRTLKSDHEALYVQKLYLWLNLQKPCSLIAYRQVLRKAGFNYSKHGCRFEAALVHHGFFSPVCNFSNILS